MEPLTPAANTPTAAPAPELVCPAGSLPALKAAIDHGADCVYLGLRDATNARNFAGLNFDEAAIASGIAYAHQRGRKVFMALNTYPQAANPGPWRSAVDKAVDMGLDAVILADTPSPDRWNVGHAGAKHTMDELGSFDALVQVWGDVDRDAMPGVRCYPRHAPSRGHMGVLLSDLGPEPIIRLQAGGLKVGEVLARRSSDPNALAYCQPLIPGAPT